MEKAKKFKVIDIPLAHFVIRQNIAFMEDMATLVLNGEWTISDVREYLESCGYRRETAERFIRGVMIRLRQHQGKRPVEEKSDEEAK
jgi:hypothetical protein